MSFDSIMEFLMDNDLDPAMEIDILAGGDPTTDTSNPEAQQGNAGGTANPNTAQNVNADNPNEDADTADTGAEDTGDDMDDAGGDDYGGGDEDIGEDDMGDDDGGAMDDVDTNSTPTDDPDIDRRINLRKLITALINAYDVSINAMSKSTPPADDGLANKYYNLQEKMARARDILYNIATRDIYIKPYEDSLRRYSALNQLYSICVEYLNTILIKKAPVRKRRRLSTAFANQIKI